MAIRIVGYLLTTVLFIAGSWVHAQPVPVKLIHEQGGWRLTRGGKPYFIKGAGGHEYLDQLVAAGGNSIRTWGVGDDTQGILDKAHRLGLTVTLGIWLAHESPNGFSYDNPADLAKQKKMVKEAVLRYKDDPAVLIWGLGNEMEGAGDKPQIYKAVNDLAKMVHELDPDHPTMTVLAELGANGKKAREVNRLCPDIDIVGINSYAGMSSIAQRYLKAGGTKPFIITEFGPPGHWEVGKSSWGAPLEPTSTQKMEWYRKGYEATVLGHRNLCLGSYAFLWGAKQEATPTWYGMFLKDGTRLGPIDMMTQLWSGKLPANQSPRLEKLTVDHNIVKPGQTVTAKVQASDPDGNSLTIHWVLTGDVKHTALGRGHQDPADEMAHAVVKTSPDHAQATVRLPHEPGRYRLFAYIRDGHGSGAVANVPILATDATESDLPQQSLPFVVYKDAAANPSYIPSGYMGQAGAIKMDLKSNANPHSGATCISVTYNKPGDWAGVAWQNPVNNWGDKPGGFNLSGAKTLSFWVRGEKGGEVVKFGFGLLGRDKKFFDTARDEIQVTLTPQWKQYKIDLKGKDLSRIITGFYWVLAGQGQPVRFYLDDIVYEK